MIGKEGVKAIFGRSELSDAPWTWPEGMKIRDWKTEKAKVCMIYE